TTKGNDGLTRLAAAAGHLCARMRDAGNPRTQMKPAPASIGLKSPHPRRTAGAILQGLTSMVRGQGEPGLGRAMRKFVLAGMGCAALALGACSTIGVNTGSFWVQPGKYDFLKCPDLASRWIADSTKEQQLLSLMQRADQETVGPVVNLMVYRSD